MRINNFSDKIYALTRKIPKGKISTYKILAQKLHCKSYRTVGQALKRNPFAPVVPCHRVVNSDGSLGGYSGRLNSKKKISLLKKEGIKVKNNRIVGFEKKIYIFKKISLDLICMLFCFRS